MSTASPPAGRSPPDTASPNGNGISAAHVQIDIAKALAVDSPDSQMRASTSSPEMLQGSNNRGTDPLMDVLYSGWDPDLPQLDVLSH